MRKTRTKPRDKPSTTAIAWADDTNRFPDDQRLRRWGYRIVSRPRKGEAVWMLACGVVHTHTEAMGRLAEFERLGRPAAP